MTSCSTDEIVIPPDPVIEFYKKTVDRAALRENLKLTVEERLQKLQQRVDAENAAQRGTRVPTPVAVREHPQPAYGDDPLIEAFKKDVDRTLLRENLKLTPEQRLDQLQAFVDGLASIRGAARRNL